MKIILKYFPNLSDFQINQLLQLKSLYLYWNSKINVISRKTMYFLYQNHILHSLAIAKIIKFKSKTKILDVGTGGGFPGIPLAILFPDSKFFLIDSINKKIKVVESICKKIKLDIDIQVIRAEKLNQKFDFVLGRGVTSIEKFIFLIYNLFNKNSFNDVDNGLFYLKGGNLDLELFKFSDYQCINYKIFDFYDEEFFKKKYIIYISHNNINRYINNLN